MSTPTTDNNLPKDKIAALCADFFTDNCPDQVVNYLEKSNTLFCRAMDKKLAEARAKGDVQDTIIACGHAAVTMVDFITFVKTLSNLTTETPTHATR